MLIHEVIQRVVSRNLRFDFIESTVTATDGHLLSSLKGRAQADLADDSYQYHFVPRGPLATEWAGPDGYLDAEGAGAPSRRFFVEGTEKGSATWGGTASNLRLVRGSHGPAIHGKVREWSRTDSHAVHTAFVRVIVPGRFLYPVTIRHTAGRDARMASVTVENVNIDFRDYQDYTEIRASDPIALPEQFAEAVVSALAVTLDQSMDWVYKERHREKRRTISVQAVPDLSGAFGEPPPLSPDPVPRYRAFWKSYAEHLAGLL